MPHRAYMALDSVIVTITSVTASVSGLLLGDLTPVTYREELVILLLPLVGAMIISGGMIVMNPAQETRKIVIGRSIFALFFGALGPTIVMLIYPPIASITVKPALLLFIGGIISGLVYVLSRPFARELYDRAERVAKAQADRLEDRVKDKQEGGE